MKRNSVNLLKGLNQRLQQGNVKYPRRQSDFALPGEKRFPLYPFSRFLDTVALLSKSENLEKLDDPFEVMARIIDYRDNNYANVMQKSASAEVGIYFHVSGKKIKDSIAGKIGKLKKEIAIKKKEYAVVNDQLNGFVEEPEKPFEESWRYRDINGHIEKLESIARNIDVKKTYKLTEWDLSRYGL